jgi:dipeptidyl aminopeptidase/acylaminoacyl peptidase
MTTKRPIEIEDLFRIRLVNDPQVAPDGRRIAYTVTELDEKDNRYRAAIWLLNLGGSGEPRRLTSGRHRDGQPRWSPDGQTIAFTSDRETGDDEIGKGQLWTIRVAGGEPARLSGLKEGVEEFAWSPDGRAIVAVSKVLHGEKNDDTDVRHITTIRYRYDGEGYLDGKYRQLFVIDAASGEARQLTEGPYEHTNPAWSPTGHEIAFASNRETDWEISHVRDIYTVRVGGSAIRRVTDGTGAWSHPSWSPDGTRIACYGTRELESDHALTEVFVVPSAGGSPESLTGGFDRSMRDQGISDLASFPLRPPLWDTDGQSLSVVFSDQGSVHLARITAADGELTQLTSGRRRAGGIALAPGAGYVFAANDAVNPGELYAAGADGRNIRQLTHVNDDWLAEVEIVEPEPFTVPSADGTPIHGWIMKPVGFEEGKKYPLLLEIHGGPYGMYAESMMHEFQLLAARGYVVLYTNPRGSASYGDAFAGTLFRAWGKADFPDLMAAVDWAIAQGYVDENRLGVLGGSYGGYMTNWVITHTNRFKAAVTQRTVSNLYSSFGTDDIMYAHAPHTFGAWPWEDPDIYWELSPISYVDRIETPLLIEHQDEDYRCPLEQAEQLFTALKRQGKTVELVRYPEESHGMSRTGKPKHRVDRLRRMTEWMDRYV